MKWHKGIVDYCYEAGATAVKVVHVTPDSRPKGWDIADAEKEGLGQRGVELIIRDRIQAWPADRHRKWKSNRLRRQDRKGARTMELEITAMSNEIERLNRMTPSSMSARHALNLEELTEAKNKLHPLGSRQSI